MSGSFISHQCGSCGHRMSIPLRYEGLDQKCRKCGALFTVPAPVQVQDEPESNPKALRDDSPKSESAEGSMFGFIKRIFASEENPYTSDSAPPPPDRAVNEVFFTDSQNSADNSYFETMNDLREAISNRQFDRAAQLALENLRQIPALVATTSGAYGSFDIRSIPAIEQGGMMLALAGDSEGLREMRELVTATKELEPWLETVDQQEKNLKVFVDIVKAVEQNPGCLQTDLKTLIGHSDGRRIATLVSWLHKAGRLVRKKHKRTHKLSLPGASQSTSLAAPKVVRSHREGRKNLYIRQLNISLLPYVPLPRAPMRWEENEAGHAPAPAPTSDNFFEIHGAGSWGIDHVEKIPMKDRPDTAFRLLHPIDSGLLMIDDLGNAEGFGEIEAAVLRFDRSGDVAAQTGLAHSTYRVGVNALGRGLIAMSKDGVVHAYDDDLQPILETSCRKAPEVKALQQRLGIGDGELKNHLRCVSLSHDHSRYLLTGVDEAWCIDMEGNGIWGAKLPLSEGWQKISSPSQSYGTSREIEHALEVMGLTLPMTPDELKQRYRELAKKWHPDLNPGDPLAGERMRAVISAAELLSGVDAAALPKYAGATYAKDLRSIDMEIGGQTFTASISMVVGEKHAADWIYGAAFSGKSNSSFLAGYSGRVIQLDENGRGVRAYDIGAVPRRIIDTGDYLYFLTDTRLYVLRDESLHALVDTHEAGDLVMAQNGFGLLEKKRFRWFREDGAYLGSVVTKSPIRRVYCTSEGLVVETRQRRALVKGAPGWWE